MKKENIYIDLSKCSVEQIKNIEKILKNRSEKIGYHTNNALINGVVLEDIYLYFSTSFQEWCLWPDKFKDRTELTYHKFIGFFEEPKKLPSELLKEYLKNTPREQVLKDWESTAEHDSVDSPKVLELFEGRNEENQIYTKEDVEKAYRAGENNQTYYFKDSTVILPNTYEGVDG